MGRVERRDQAPEPPKEEQVPKGEGVSRRDFLVGSGAGVAGLILGGVIGREAFPKEPLGEEEAAPAAAPAAGDAPAEESVYQADYTIEFDPYVCTGCMSCAQACAEKWATELHPEETKDVMNLQFSRIRPTRFQYVDVISVCAYCQLEPWAEGSDEFPCQNVCPEGAIMTVPEGEGKPGYYGMGYKWIDQEKCLGADKCWRCAEICEDQFGSGVSFDPITKKAQVCSRCGGDPECVKACPETNALMWVPITSSRNGRYHAFQVNKHAELLYRKMFNVRRTL